MGRTYAELPGHPDEVPEMLHAAGGARFRRWRTFLVYPATGPFVLLIRPDGRYG